MEEEKNSKPAGARRLVIPGELLGRGRAGHGTYEDEGNVLSKVIGLAESKGDMHFVIPLGGVYSPKRGDGVVGRVTDVIFQKWILDIKAPYEAVLPLSEGVEGYVDLTKADLTKFFDYGDVLFAEIVSVSKQKHVTLTMRSQKCRKLRGGRLIKITPAKVPRIIGKAGSMVEMVKQMTGTQIVVGQNGVVWVRGEHEDLATEAILAIEEKSHIRGLTDHVRGLLEKRLKEMGVSVPPVKPPMPREQAEAPAEAAEESEPTAGEGGDDEIETINID